MKLPLILLLCLLAGCKYESGSDSVSMDRAFAAAGKAYDRGYRDGQRDCGELADKGAKP